MMNCLTFSLKYRIRNKNSKMYIEYAWMKVFSRVENKKVILRFLRFIGLVDGFMFLICPHFYIIHDGVRIDLDPDTYEIIKSEPEHVYDDLISLTNEFSTNE